MTDRIWIECTCDYRGYAELVEYEKIPGVKFPTCPECGETIYDIGKPTKELLSKMKEG